MGSAKVQINARRIDLGRISLNIREVGDGQPVIFLHGITSTGAVFDPLAWALAGEAFCVGVDQRGHGRSDKPEMGYEDEDFAKDLLALIAALGRGPAIVVGHSLGARNALTAAMLQPELVKAIVAIDFTPYIETEALDALQSRVNGGDRLFASRDDVEAYLQGRYPLLPKDAVARRAEFAFAKVEGGFRPLASAAAMDATATGLRGDLVPATKAVTCPTLLVRGALSKLVSEQAFAKTQQLRPDLRALVVPGVDHYVNEEAPDVIIAEIRNFLRLG